MSITDNLRDAAYIVIGMGVISVNRAQARRQELRKQFGDYVKQADAAISPLVDAVESQFDAVVDRLPEQARQLIEPARQAGKDAREQVRSRVVPS